MSINLFSSPRLQFGYTFPRRSLTLTQSREGCEVVPRDLWVSRLHATFRAVIYGSILFHIVTFEGRPIVARYWASGARNFHPTKCVTPSCNRIPGCFHCNRIFHSKINAEWNSFSHFYGSRSGLLDKSFLLTKLELGINFFEKPMIT